MKPLENLYGKSMERRMLDERCAGCLGGRDEELKDEAVLLCDGEGFGGCGSCTREYHLSCTFPDISKVPEGDFFCIDCDPEGSTRILRDYFDEMAEERSKFQTSAQFVQHLVQKHMQSSKEEARDDPKTKSTEHKHNNTIDNPENDDPGTLDAPPASELGRAQKLYHAIMDEDRFRKASNVHAKHRKSDLNGNGKRTIDQVTSSAPVPIPVSSSSASSETIHKPPHPDTAEPIDRDFFIGKIIKLYCPKDNMYHTGRIIDWRSALPSGIEPSIARTHFYGDSVQASTEFYVRFASGVNGRKKTLLQWMILEEHSCAVATSVVMTLRDKGRGMNGWRPAQVLLRSCLELVPLRHLLNYHEDFGLVAFFGSEVNIYLDLKSECVDVRSNFFWDEFKRWDDFKRKGSFSTSPWYKTEVGGGVGHSGTTISSVIGQLPPTMALEMNAMNLELQEQKRTARWSFLCRRCTPMNEKALTVIDEFSPLLLLDDDIFDKESKDPNIWKMKQQEEHDGDRKEGDMLVPAPGLCPLIQRGLDKQWVANRLTGRLMKGKRKNASSKRMDMLDTSITLTRMKIRRTRLPACLAISIINSSMSKGKDH